MYVRAGTKPLGLLVMQTVPPVMIIKTLDSGAGVVSDRCSMVYDLQNVAGSRPWCFLNLVPLSQMYVIVEGWLNWNIPLCHSGLYQNVRIPVSERNNQVQRKQNSPSLWD